ncbi:MAG: chemosensory pili system protein ChpA (sensor histidine kinase/response regulator) [Crocinitomicaceae bacterium]|jgi:chemosensory pili system protein ChpA (sensor histidine kinase/response regulator)
MGGRHDFVALDWVKGEIEEVLKQAQYELEAYVESPDDTARMRFCLTYLHQVRGTLQMVEFYGAAMLAEEMEGVAQAMLDDSVSDAVEARQVLMQAILQLPNYLDHIKLGHRDLPLVLLPVLNDLRGARGESLLSETSLFQPDIKPSAPINDLQRRQFSDKQFIDLARKLRQMYQVALLGLLQGKDTEHNSEYLQKVTARLAKILKDTPAGSLWNVAAAALEGITSKGILITSGVKESLKRLEPELKSLINNGSDSFNKIPEDLLKNLLFYVAKSETSTARIEAVRKEFELDLALPSSAEVDADRSALSGPDKATMSSVAIALIEEITSLKEKLDILVQGRGADASQMSELLPGFKKIGDTMGVLGLGTPRTVVLDQYDVITDFVSSNRDASNTELMDIAGALLYVEASLVGLSDRFNGNNESSSPERIQLNDAQQVVLKESIKLVEQIKDKVVEYIPKRDVSLLAEAASLLMNLRGALIMVPQVEAADIARSCSNILQKHADSQSHPADFLLNSLAEALSGIEYFLERLEESSQFADKAILNKARAAILPYISPYDLSPEDGVLDIEALEEDDLIEVDFGLEELELESIDEPIIELDKETVQSQSLNNELRDSLSEISELPVIEVNGDDDSGFAVDALDDALDLSSEIDNQAELQQSINTLSDVTLELDDDDDLIDDEIIEIFLEEAEEVLETIEEFWPIYKADQQNDDSLATTRRAFHTLKGSGRMVSAEEIGETAWSIENMFNRMIDHTISFSPNFIDIVDYTITKVPALIDAFKNRKASAVDVLAIQEYAHALSKGDSVAPWVTALDIKTESSTLIESNTAEDDNIIDAALLEVFSQELKTHLAVIQDFIETSHDEDYQTPISDELQRALHTLKGSAHMAHIENIADVAAVLEDFARNLCIYHVDTSAEIVHLFIRGKDLIDDGHVQLNNNEMFPIAGSQDLTADIQRITNQLVAQFHQSLGTSANKSIDPQVLTIFLSEGMDILTDAENLLESWENDTSNHQILATVVDDIETLEKGAQMAELLPIVALCDALKIGYNKVISAGLLPDNALVTDIKLGHEGLLNMMDMVAASQAVLPENDLVSRLGGTPMQAKISVAIERHSSDTAAAKLVIPEFATAEESIQSEVDPELLEIFLEEAEEIVNSISASLDAWEVDRDNLLQVAELQRDLHTFKGGARMSEINAIGDLAHELEDLYEGLSLGKLSANNQLFELLHICHDRLSDMVQNLKLGKRIKYAPELITAIQLYIAGESLDLPQEPVAITGNNLIAESAAEDVSADQPESISVEQMALEADAEIVEIFMEEAEELMEELDTHIQAWQAEPENPEHNEAIQRVLHTLKGGARITGLKDIGDLAHDMETELNSRLVNNEHGDESLFQELISQYDVIMSRIDSVQLWLTEGAQGPLMTSVEGAGNITEEQSTASLDSTKQESIPKQTNVVALHPKPEKALAAQQQKAEGQQSKRAGPQEMIKVPADLLDGLVNLAGETSISRGRLENQVTDFSYSLEDMDATLDRMRDQLRRLDMETEAQVLFRREQQGPDYEDFDPLEMDRYSQLQQLSRSLVESASDLVDIKSTLLNKTRDAETLLLQQSRVNTELQEGLMKTRMVPFVRMVPRLRRIVRQISSELGKQVELEVNNADGEMDRSVLERLISPLEHMLRNAVDHGLETTAGRIQVGKSEVGSIQLDLSRDGSDVVIRLVDDGAGINLEKVRAKAIERGLLEKDAQLSDQEIMQFILQAGFSTAEQITQISGRGVGMDVVNSEIKQVGGTVTINSNPGQGTEFTIRLPFTVSVNRALMTKVGEALFAIPLNSIEGIVRVSTNNLRELYKQDKPVYSYGGRDYQLEYLGHLLRDENQAKLPDSNVQMPVVLVRGAQPAAIQVDTLMGSREIVVKALGPQFNSVVGVSGGTILGDGSVVIILDLPNMMRHVNSIEYKQHLELEHQAEAQLTSVKTDSVVSVLVVDDSVTVRKVTSRLLERQGYEVLTAKDGVDAMAILQDYRPSLVLLDIEMPRMDGFEVATQMRHSSQLKDIPIIMITSRTGDKHKERAMGIGVNDYMGKPFQEDKLLAAISQLTDLD